MTLLVLDPAVDDHADRHVEEGEHDGNPCLPLGHIAGHESASGVSSPEQRSNQIEPHQQSELPQRSTSLSMLSEVG